MRISEVILKSKKKKALFHKRNLGDIFGNELRVKAGAMAPGLSYRASKDNF